MPKLRLPINNNKCFKGQQQQTLPMPTTTNIPNSAPNRSTRTNTQSQHQTTAPNIINNSRSSNNKSQFQTTASNINNSYNTAMPTTKEQQEQQQQNNKQTHKHVTNDPGTRSGGLNPIG